MSEEPHDAARRVSTETRDALREALTVYLNDRFGYRGPDDGSDPDDFDGDAAAILAMVRVTDAPDAEGLQPLDVERLTEATESVLGRGEVSTSDGSMGTDHAARLIAAAYDALDPRR